jgi:hypothetical protein
VLGVLRVEAVIVVVEKVAAGVGGVRVVGETGGVLVKAGTGESINVEESGEVEKEEAKAIRSGGGVVVVP